MRGHCKKNFSGASRRTCTPHFQIRFDATAPFMFNSPDGGVPLGRSSSNFTGMSMGGKRTKWRRNIAENFNRLSRVHEHYRRQTDGRRHIANVNMSSRSLRMWLLQQTRSSSGDEIANVNFLYDDIVHVLQNTMDSWINSATDRRGGYVLECWNVCLQVQ